MVHEALSPEELDFEGIHDIKVCKDDRNNFTTIFELKDLDRIALNPS